MCPFTNFYAFRRFFSCVGTSSGDVFYYHFHFFLLNMNNVHWILSDQIEKYKFCVCVCVLRQKCCFTSSLKDLPALICTISQIDKLHINIRQWWTCWRQRSTQRLEIQFFLKQESEQKKKLEITFTVTFLLLSLISLSVISGWRELHEWSQHKSSVLVISSNRYLLNTLSSEYNKNCFVSRKKNTKNICGFASTPARAVYVNRSTKRAAKNFKAYN